MMDVRAMDDNLQLALDLMRHGFEARFVRDDLTVYYTEKVPAVSVPSAVAEPVIASGALMRMGYEVTLSPAAYSVLDTADQLRVASGDGAVLSPCQRFRYRLWRATSIQLGLGAQPNKGRMVWILANPSTADATTPDNTERTVRARARKDGYAAVEIVNLCPYRETHPELIPADLSQDIAEQAAVNLAFLRLSIERADAVAFGWGDVGESIGRGVWLEYARPTLDAVEHPLCVKANASGAPKHPLRMTHAQPLTPYHFRDS